MKITSTPVYRKSETGHETKSPPAAIRDKVLPHTRKNTIAPGDFSLCGGTLFFLFILFQSGEVYWIGENNFVGH